MKKLLATILTIIYLGTSAGATLHIHYCMGKLADWGLGHNSSAICSHCGMNKSESMDNPCCKDEYKVVQNNTDQVVTETGFPVVRVEYATLPVYFFENCLPGFLSITTQNLIGHEPPRNGSVAIYLRNSVFRI